jgi:hypothetical protein
MDGLFEVGTQHTTKRFFFKQAEIPFDMGERRLSFVKKKEFILCDHDDLGYFPQPPLTKEFAGKVT